LYFVFIFLIPYILIIFPSSSSPHSIILVLYYSAQQKRNLSSIPLCKCTTFFVSIPLLRGIWVLSSFLTTAIWTGVRWESQYLNLHFCDSFCCWGSFTCLLVVCISSLENC
jgi:hypothetical protein